jgi:hypothetical protein
VTIRIILSILFLFLFYRNYAQEKRYARILIDTLCSNTFSGRGYVNSGDSLAACFIEQEFIKNGLIPFNSTYKQSFSFSVNTFPTSILVETNKNTLIAGKDFLIDPSSPSIEGTFKIKHLAPTILKNEKKLNKLLSADLHHYFLAIDLLKYDKKNKDLITDFNLNKTNAAGILLLNNNKLTWSVSRTVSDKPIIETKKELDLTKAKKIHVKIQNKFIKQHLAHNVIGYFKGTQYPDSFIVFTAHYDHLGILGSEAIFRGANDNASGIAMLLTLTEYFKQHPSKYSLAFIAFAGEEAGLIGSSFFVKNPLFPLNKIKLLINLDLVGTGDDGITVVNANNNIKYFNLLNKINNNSKLITVIKSRNNAPNSDHYPFTENFVPAVFIYAMGGIQAYHDIYDIPQTLPLTKFNEIVELIIQSIAEY